LDTVSEEDRDTSKSKKQIKKAVINPLPLDMIISHVSNFGVNLESLENKLSQNQGLGLQIEQLTTQNKNSNSTGGQVTSVGGNNQGVAGGIDSQSLETILEFKDGLY
jgi:hypothetical protein